MSTSSHPKPHQSSAPGEIPPLPTPHGQDQTAAKIEALDGQLAFHDEQVKLAEEKAAVAMASMDRLKAEKAELLARQQAAEEAKAQTDAHLKVEWDKQQEANGLVRKLAGKVAAGDVAPEEVLDASGDKRDVVVSVSARVLGASGHTHAHPTVTPASPATPPAPKLVVELGDKPTDDEQSLKPDLVINPDGTSKLVVSLDNQPPAATPGNHGKGAPLPPPAPEAKPLIITPADIPKPAVVDTATNKTPNLPPPSPTTPNLPPVAPAPKTGETTPTPVVDPSIVPRVPDATVPLPPPTPRSGSTETRPTDANEAAAQAKIESTKHEADSTLAKVNEELERYVKVSIKHRKTSPLLGRGKLEDTDTELNKLVEKFLTATLEHHSARFDAKQYTVSEQQRLRAVIQPKIDSAVTDTLEGRLRNLYQTKLWENIEQRVEAGARQHKLEKPTTTTAEIDILKGQLRETYSAEPLSSEEAKKIDTIIVAERQKGLNDEEKEMINAYRDKLLAEGLPEGETDKLVRSYLITEATRISLKIAEGIYKGESEGKQDKTRFAFRTAFAKDIAEVKDGKLRKIGRFGKKWGVVALASITAHTVGRALGESGLDKAVRVGASVASARGVVNYANRGIARQNIGTRDVFHPAGSIRPINAVKRNIDGVITSGTVDYDHADTLALERKHRAVVAANTRIVEQINGLDISNKDTKEDDEKTRVVKNDFLSEAYTKQTEGIRRGNRKRARAATAIGLTVGLVAEANMHGSGKPSSPNKDPNVDIENPGNPGL